MSPLAQQIGRITGVTVTALLLVSAAVAGYMMTPRQRPCVSLDYIITDADERLYITEGELNRLLLSKELYPVGRALPVGALHRIERAVTDHPMVRHAECYCTPRQQMRIRLSQRVPVLRVETPVEEYFIDADRRVMPFRETVRDTVLTVRGYVSPVEAAGELTTFALWLADNPYWQRRVHHVYVQSHYRIYLYMRGGQPRVLLGTISGYERKLAKLRKFFDNSPEEILRKPYQEWDIRFRGQVIGRL